ncbi:MAG: periplasmic heavy metal sensor [Acidobacteria bacterium]|nr:periplasmic heavy metal sensor [Acidobacteriota bacterium]
MKPHRNRHPLPLLLLLVFPLGLAFGQAPGPGPGADPDAAKLPFSELPGKWWKHPRVVDDLKLTPDQVDRIESIFFDHSKKLVDLKGRLTKATMDLGRVSDNDNAPREAVLGALDLVLAARSELARATVIMQLDIRGQLTPEQRKELKHLRQLLRQDRKDRPLDRPPDRRIPRNPRKAPPPPIE